MRLYILLTITLLTAIAVKASSDIKTVTPIVPRTDIVDVVDSTATIKNKKDSINYIPNFHAIFRGRWEDETTSGFSHFLVRNARASVDGKVAPILSYLLNVDFCDKGKIFILDAYATVGSIKGFSLKVGQYRMPFGYDSFRGPGNYYFNNRSFIGKQMNNYRAAGFSLLYAVPRTPLTVEGGIFNPTTIENQSKWVKKYAYAGRVVYKPGGFVFAAGFESLIPDSVRINLASATVGWGIQNFYVEGEYMARMYTHKTHKTTHAYNFFANYSIPLTRSILKSLSFQARFDGMTDCASGIDPLVDNKLTTTYQSRKRFTVGSMLDYEYKFAYAGIRINYEKYWYREGFRPPRGESDMLTAELILKFSIIAK